MKNNKLKTFTVSYEECYYSDEFLADIKITCNTIVQLGDYRVQIDGSTIIEFDGMIESIEEVIEKDMEDK